MHNRGERIFDFLVIGGVVSESTEIFVQSPEELEVIVGLDTRGLYVLFQFVELGGVGTLILFEELEYTADFLSV